MRAQYTIAAALIVLCVLTAPAYAETVSGTMKAKVKIYTFIPDNSGTVQITIMAQKTRAFIFLALDSSGEITWCSAVSKDQLVRCDFGGLRGDTVGVGIATISGSQKFTMNVTGPVDENVFRMNGDLVQRLEAGVRALQRAATE